MFALNLKTIRTPQEHVEEVFQAEAFTAAFASEIDGFSVVSPITLSLDVDKRGEDFRLSGRVRAVLDLTCSRCLEPFTWPVDSPFDLWYRPLTAQADATEREIQDEDFSNAFYEHDEIDLGQLVLERLYLALPMKPLCQEACRGLCSQCGANLNRSTCSCQPEWGDPRLAALKALKKDS